MGQSHSSDTPRNVSAEQLSHELALRFASRCYTHLEIAHFTDNFKSLADHQDGIEYWKEDTLCRFLCLPDAIQAGPVLHQMCSYLGAFPFPSQAPCILTREAMVKVVTIMTGRYRKILKKGDHDKIKLLFRSLAVFDRRASMIPAEKEKPDMQALDKEQMPEEDVDFEDDLKKVRSHVAGFSIDQPANDNEEEDDDDLALAALDSLDAIEVFKHDQKIDRKIHHAQIPAENFKRLVMLLLVLAPSGAQDNIAMYGHSLNNDKLLEVERSASSMIASFEPDEENHGIKYTNFVKVISSSMPDLFEPLNALFEHFLFSKNIDLSRHKNEIPAPVPNELGKPPIIVTNSTDSASYILNAAIMAQLSTTLQIDPSATGRKNIFQTNAQFHSLYSTTNHGTSMSSFSRQVLSWQSSTLLLLSGTLSEKPYTPITIGAYLLERWTDSSSNSPMESASKAVMFQLSPFHAVFPANPYNRSTPVSYFSSKTGISLGCVIPVASRSNKQSQTPILGPVSLLIDPDISTARFQHDVNGGTGAFLTDPVLDDAQNNKKVLKLSYQEKKFEIDIDLMEVWGINIPSSGDDGEDEVTKQKKRLAWEEAEAARRRGVNFGGDKDGARALLEMAGLVGDKAGNRSGGSV